MDLGLGLENTHVLITGGAGLIGRVCVSAFLAAGARVSSLDVSYPIIVAPNNHKYSNSNVDDTQNNGNGESGESLSETLLPSSSSSSSPSFTPAASSRNDSESRLCEIHCDITDARSLHTAWETATRAFGTVETCLALASLDLSVLPQADSICDVDVDVWTRVLDTNVWGTFLTAQKWLIGIRESVQSQNAYRDRYDDRDGGGGINGGGNDESAVPLPPPQLKNPGLIIMGSEAGHFGVRTQAVYAASKSAVQYGLLQSLRADAPRVCPRARVNAVAPGPVETPRFHEETGGPGTREWWAECEATTALKQPVPAEAVARSLLFLASERWSANVHGQVLNVDSGKQGALMWAPEGLNDARKVLQEG